ncbi:MAG: hypothetical protein KDI92_00265 [Xanthomonadales bacterium]|nr:hypothetical protein [Xanthomonadales bacterium]
MTGRHVTRGFKLQALYTSGRLIELYTNDDVVCLIPEGRSSIEDLVIIYKDGSEEVVQIKSTDSSFDRYKAIAVIKEFSKLLKVNSKIFRFRLFIFGAVSNGVMKIHRTCNSIRNNTINQSILDLSQEICIDERIALQTLKMTIIETCGNHESHEKYIESQLIEAGVGRERLDMVLKDIWHLALDRASKSENNSYVFEDDVQRTMKLVKPNVKSMLRYCSELISSHDTYPWQIGSSKKIIEHITLPLKTAYWSDSELKTLNYQPLSVNEIVEDAFASITRLFFILSGQGGGKTTMIRQLVLFFAKKAQKHERKIIPISVIASDLLADGDWRVRLKNAMNVSTQVPGDLDVFERWSLKLKFKWILMIDRLDEISDEPNACEKIMQVVLPLLKRGHVVTLYGRPTSKTKDLIKYFDCDDDIKKVTKINYYIIDNPGRNEIRSLVKNWTQVDPDEFEKKFRLVKTQKGFFEPIFISLILNSLPRVKLEKSSLYTEMYKAASYEWIKRAEQKGIDKKIVEIIILKLQSMAYELTCDKSKLGISPDNKIPYDWVIGQISLIIEDYKDCNAIIAEYVTKDAMKSAGEDNGFFTREQDVFEWPHSSMREYLCARELASKINKRWEKVDDIFSKFIDLGNKNIVSMCAGLLLNAGNDLKLTQWTTNVCNKMSLMSDINAQNEYAMTVVDVFAEGINVKNEDLKKIYEFLIKITKELLNMDLCQSLFFVNKNPIYKLFLLDEYFPIENLICELEMYSLGIENAPVRIVALSEIMNAWSKIDRSDRIVDLVKNQGQKKLTENAIEILKSIEVDAELIDNLSTND